MKKIVIIATYCLLLLSGRLLAHHTEWPMVSDSDYVPITNSIKHWKEIHTHWANQYEFEYLLGTDTIMSVGQGKKVYMTPYNLNNLVFIGILQENIAEKKVYFIRTSPFFPGFNYSENTFPLNTPQILYDFNVSVGDTLHWLPNQYANVVAAIDSIKMLDNTWRRKIRFTNDISKQWVEGMGGLFGLFTSYPQPGDTESFHYLVCYSEGNTLLYHPHPDFDCEYATVTSTQEPHLNKSYYPNPSSGEVNLPFLSDRNHYIDVYDMASRWIQGIESNGNSLDLRHLNNGMYILEVHAGDHIEAIRVVIQH